MAQDINQMSSSDLSKAFAGKSQADIDQIKKQLANAPGGQDIVNQLTNKIQSAYDQGTTYDNQQKLNKEQQDAADKQTAYAQSLKDQADKFRGNLGSYIGDQVSNAQGVSRRNLNEDKQNVKNDASSRGLLYSGVKSGNDASAEGYESGKLGSQIQGINTNANNQANAKDNLAVQAKAGADQSQIGVQQNQINQNQTAYQQALQQQQSQNNFWSSLLQGAGAIGGLAAGLL